jgi:NAD(P)-dependent dehydrogenase (short-subunit alcohol dehydrogenase family)
MTGLMFPLWQIDRQEYDALCAYLRVTPNERLFGYLSDYLAKAPFRFPPAEGFGLYLAGLRLGRWRIARLDLVTKRFLPNHRLRHALNGILALHECDGQGYPELAASPRGPAAVLATLGWGLGFLFNIALALPWLGWQFLNYAVGMPFRVKDNLAGKRVLISGVSRGLGQDLMFHCLEHGAEVVGVVRNRESADHLAARLPAEAPVTLVAADLAQPGAIVDALRQARIPAESIAIAILSAATKYDGTSVLSLPELRDTIQVNFLCAAEFAAWLCAADGVRKRDLSTPTRLVLISSMGRWHGMLFSCGYNASKAALSIWGESLDMELRQLGDRQITVTVVEPGLFASDMTRQTALTRYLFASRRKVARRILAGTLAGKRSIRPPMWFALLTWGACLMGRDLRYRLLAGARPRADR